MSKVDAMTIGPDLLARAAVNTVGGLIAAAKAKPGELKFGSSGTGTGTHLGAEEFNRAAGIKGLHIPAGPTDAIADGGEPMHLTQSEFSRFVLSESERAVQIVKAAEFRPPVADCVKISSFAKMGRASAVC